MIIGVPKEIKSDEHRVGLTIETVAGLTRLGHKVLVESNAGLGIDYDNDLYQAHGAQILNSAKEIYEQSDLIIKVKEPQLNECEMLRKDQIIFTYLHLAADKEQATALCASGCTAIAYETVSDPQGRLPLLQPMSQVAGRMSIQVGARCLEKSAGGRGLLLGGVPGVMPAQVIILGGGTAGFNAMQMAIGSGADVTVFDTSLARLSEINAIYGGRVKTIASNQIAIEKAITTADLVIGAVLIPGASAPKLISKQMLSTMKKGSVLVDISIDQGGCFETSHPTTHHDPYYEIDGVVHYSVANMPGAVARTSAFALNSATQKYIFQLANEGLQTVYEDKYFYQGVNIHKGKVCNLPVAKSLNLEYFEFKI